MQDLLLFKRRIMCPACYSCCCCCEADTPIPTHTPTPWHTWQRAQVPACLPVSSSVPQFPASYPVTIPPIHCAIFYLHFSLVVCLHHILLLNPFFAPACCLLLLLLLLLLLFLLLLPCPAAVYFLPWFCLFYLHFPFIFLMSCNFCFICRRHACTNTTTK